MKVQALILAAGRGSRLGDQAGASAKALVHVDRRPLVEHQLESLAAAGVGPVAMVIGHAGDEIQQVVGARVDYVWNPRWQVTNSLYSFWLAREWVQGDVVVLNCDILFAPAVLDRVLETEGDALAYDSSSGDGREQMSVSVLDGRLVDVRKDLPDREVSGENVGLLKLTRDTARLLFEKAGELIEQGRERDWLGAAVREVARTRPIRAVDVAGVPWCEIDFPQDLHVARRETWPAIRRARRRAKPTFRVARWLTAALVAILALGSAYRAWVRPLEVTWEALDVEGAAREVLESDGHRRHWWLVAGGGAARAPTQGPTTVRVDARPLLAQPASDGARYVLEVAIDGGPSTFHALDPRRSESWQHAEWIVAKRSRVEVPIPDGPHEISVRLVAAESGRCLVRMRQRVPEPG